MSNRLAAINQAALDGARLFSSLSPKCDNTINELPSGIPVQPSDLIAIYRDQTRQVPVSGLFANIGRELVLYLSGASFTPIATGLDVDGNISPPGNAFGATYPTNVVWTCTEIWFRLETLPSADAVTLQIARCTSDGTFTTANYLNSTPLSIAAGAPSNEISVGPSGISAPTVNSNDKLCAYYPAIGSGAMGFSVRLTFTATF